MNKLLSIALLAALTGCGAVDVLAPATSVTRKPVTPSFDTAMPAPQEPLDMTVITAVETVGAARME